MVKARAGTWRHKTVVGLLFSTMVLSNVWQSPAAADVTGVTGSAYGHHADVTIFGGQQPVAGPAPTVTLPPGGSATPITATAPSALVEYGPATLFSSGRLTVSTEGTTGPDGSVTSTASIDTINTSQVEVFTAANLSSTCTASESGVSGSTTVTGGTLITSEGDPEVEGDETTISVPTNPAPNTAFEGALEGVGDTFRYVFNEQIQNPDGSITVNALHGYLLGPTAVGDLIIGQVVCGVTSDGQSGTTTTVDDGGTTTTTVGNGGTTTTTVGNGGTTTTTVGSTTTTMGNGGPTPTTIQPVPGDCERPTDFVGALIFDIFRGISDLLTNLGISGFEDFGCEDEDEEDSDFGFDFDSDFDFDFR